MLTLWCTSTLHPLGSRRVVHPGAPLTLQEWCLPRPCLWTGTSCSGMSSTLATTSCASVLGAPLSPPLILERGPWLRGIQCSNRLTAQLTRACTGHAPIGEYAAWFHKESSRCMCSHLHKSVIHIIHLCPLHTRSPSPGKHYQLVEFVKFLKKNPHAFEWPGADLSQSDGRGTPSGGGEVMGTPTNLRRRAKLPVGSAGGAPLAGADPPLLHHAGATLRTHQFPGAHATVLQYRRLSKPRVRREDPNQSDICLFFF